jgi:hypothetical protein
MNELKVDSTLIEIPSLGRGTSCCVLMHFHQTSSSDMQMENFLTIVKYQVLEMLKFSSIVELFSKQTIS